MRYFIGLLSIAIVVLAGLYFYLRQPAPPAPEVAQQSSPPGTPPPAAGTPPATSAGANANEKLEREAREYIKELTAVKPQPLSAENADNFVRREQTIKLGTSGRIEEVTPRQLLQEPGMTPDTPVTVIKDVEQVEVVTPEKLLERAGSDLDTPVRVLEDGKVRDTTVLKLVEKYPDQPKTPITIVKNVQETRVVTARELAANPATVETPIKILRGKQGAESATVAELLMDDGKRSTDTIYYVRAVKGSDVQGIWGIIQAGLIENFARGIAIRRGEDVNTYRVAIPHNADEMINDRNSSFLGRMIFDKSRDTYVYNFAQSRIGHNPDLIHPGQELLIIGFSPEELVAIYKHFVSGNA